jgi:hypothetical protein
MSLGRVLWLGTTSDVDSPSQLIAALSSVPKFVRLSSGFAWDLSMATHTAAAANLTGILYMLRVLAWRTSKATKGSFQNQTLLPDRPDMHPSSTVGRPLYDTLSAGISTNTLNSVYLFNFFMASTEPSSFIGKFLLNNYRQASDILMTQPQSLATMMAALGIPSDDLFKQWLAEERAYLQSLKKEPERDALEFEYLKGLIRLQECRYVFVSFEWPVINSSLG